jgi:hypothetical protein
MSTFNSKEYGWAEVDIAINGKPLGRAVSVEYTEKQEVKKLRGKGKKPFAIKGGNIDVVGKIEMHQSEFDILLALTGNKGVAGFADLTITVAFQDSDGGLSTRAIVGALVTEIGETVKQSDMEIIVPLPFEAMDIKYL